MKSAFGEKGVWKYLSKIADANSFALDAEDVWFSKPAYAQSLAGYLKANKITAEQFNADEAIRDKARAYAVKEAQRGWRLDEAAFYAVMNSLWSDYGATIQRRGMDSTDLWADLARDWLCDKAARYYADIVEH